MGVRAVVDVKFFNEETRRYFIFSCGDMLIDWIYGAIKQITKGNKKEFNRKRFMKLISSLWMIKEGEREKDINRFLNYSEWYYCIESRGSEDIGLAIEFSIRKSKVTFTDPDNYNLEHIEGRYGDLGEFSFFWRSNVKIVTKSMKE